MDILLELHELELECEHLFFVVDLRLFHGDEDMCLLFFFWELLEWLVFFVELLLEVDELDSSLLSFFDLNNRSIYVTDKCFELLELVLFSVSELLDIAIDNSLDTIAEHSEIVDIEIFAELLVALAELIMECLECLRAHRDDVVEYICDVE